MNKVASRYEIDMCSGPLTKGIIAFSLPVMLSLLLQLLYNAADIVVVGKFVDKTALAAVGSTGSLINLTINMLIGLSVGASVAVANSYGSGKKQDASETVHTAMALSLVGGALIGIPCMCFAGTFLRWMGTPENVLAQGAVYLRIYFAGLPAAMLYNFAAAVFRAVGDTKRPLRYLTVAGLIKIGLNLLFVAVFGWGVAGVAVATVISQLVSAVLIVLCMIRSEGVLRLMPSKLRIRKDKLLQILRVGIPAGIQSSTFAISNVIIQSAINSFGELVMAGNAAASNIEGFVYIGTNSLYQATLAFSGQNMGAKRYDRLNPILARCLSLSVLSCILLGGLAYLFRYPLLSIYNGDPSVISFGIHRLTIMCLTYFVASVMDIMSGQMRGMGHAGFPMLVSILGICGLRIVWLYTVFAWDGSLTTLYLSYPISWAVTGFVHSLTYVLLYRKLRRTTAAAPGAGPAEPLQPAASPGASQ